MQYYQQRFPGMGATDDMAMYGLSMQSGLTS
jgi:hypothetical protein